jgi:hypothetical protein
LACVVFAAAAEGVDVEFLVTFILVMPKQFDTCLLLVRNLCDAACEHTFIETVTSPHVRVREKQDCPPAHVSHCDTKNNNALPAVRVFPVRDVQAAHNDTLLALPLVACEHH